jgi:hypothetical protein
MVEWSLVFLSKQTKNPKQLWKETRENSSSIIFILGQAIWKQVPAFWLRTNSITHWAYQNGKC